eukprot:Em0004g1510a
MAEKSAQEKLFYKDVLRYLTERSYREEAEKQWKRTVRRKAQDFTVNDGQLYIKGKNGQEARRWVFDEEDQKRVMEVCHDDKLGGGHFGRDKTLQKICSRFYWQNMTNDVKEHVRTCDTCQRTNKRLIKASAELHPIPVRAQVWYQVGIDIVGPLTLTRNKNRYLITCTDYFSKWPEAQALPSKCAEGVAKFVLSLITRFGCFKVCISDQGREFVNSLNEKLFSLTGIEHRIASAYHPQTNGLDERLNQTVTKSLVKYINTDQSDWDEKLECVLFSYRTSVHATTKYTPFYLMYGREAVLPPQLQTECKDGNDVLFSMTGIESKAQEYATNLEEVRTEVFTEVTSNIQNAQAKQKLYYDRKHARTGFQLGDRVLLRNMRNLTRKGGKLKKEWSGTYVIDELCGKGLYRLKNESGEILKKKYNSAQLKIYQQRQEYPAAGSDENACMEGQGETDFQTERGKESSAHEILNDQLYSPSLLRLWRTGADELAYEAAEDEEFDPTAYNLEIDEYALSKDLIVELWMNHRAYRGEVPLRVICGESFVIMNDTLEEEFDRFRKHTLDLDLYVYAVEAIELVKHCQYGISGLQATTLGYHLTFDIMRKDFVQILHNGEDHWLTISTLGLPSGHVNIYDSLYQTCTDHAIDQMCSIIFTPNNAVYLHFTDVDKQTNSSDCGLYAIAYATGLCCGEEVCSRKYDMMVMRQHLLKCLESGRMTAFPSSYRENGPIVANKMIKVRCYCRLPDSGVMIQCSSCKEWFHKKCDSSIPRKAWSDLKFKWHCKMCQSVPLIN